MPKRKRKTRREIALATAGLTPEDALDAVSAGPGAPAKGAGLTRLEILALLGFITLAVWASWRAWDFYPRSTGGTAGAAYDPARGSWRAIIPPPLLGRSHPAAVWARRRMLVWGGVSGDRYFNDGASYDPKRNTWKRLPDSRRLTGRADPVTAWTGEELLIFGGRTGKGPATDGAAYNPDTKKWRALPDSPLPVVAGKLPAVWTGEKLVVAGPESQSSGAAYDLESNKWDEVPPSGLGAGLVDPVAVWMDQYQKMLILTGLKAATYDPSTGRWVSLPHPYDDDDLREVGTILSKYPSVAVWTGREALFVGAASHDQPSGAAYDPENKTWRPLIASGLSQRLQPIVISTGEEVLMTGGKAFSGDRSGGSYLDDGVFVYNFRTGFWSSLRTFSSDLLQGESFLGRRVSPATVWTGQEMVVWGDRVRPQKPPRKTPIAQGRIAPGRWWQFFAWTEGSSYCMELKERGSQRSQPSCPGALEAGKAFGNPKGDLAPWDESLHVIMGAVAQEVSSVRLDLEKGADPVEASVVSGPEKIKFYVALIPVRHSVGSLVARDGRGKELGRRRLGSDKSRKRVDFGR